MSQTDELQECQGCGKPKVTGFCDKCEIHGVTSIQGSGMGGVFAKAASIESTTENSFEYTCQCSSCRIHKAMRSEDGKPWKCLKPNSVGNGGFFCIECMYEMSYNNELDKYCYDDETKPAFREAASRTQRSKSKEEANIEPFLADVTDVTNKSDDNVVCVTLYDRYTRYCQGNGLNRKSYVEFGKELIHQGIEKRR